MVVVADASVAIRGDMSGFHQDLRGAEAATGGLGAKLKDIFSPKNLMLGAGALGIGLGIRQLVGFAGEAADMAMEIQQTQRTVDDVFGNSAGVIEDWAERSADAAGLSQRAVFQTGALFGQTLRNMGFEADAAADWTVKLQQRAAEMAVAYGQTPERAILAISAAIRGERDTIEKFGVSIKQWNVNAKVAEMGMSGLTGSAKNYAQALAILELVMEQTDAQQGRFADGSDDMAVKMAKLHANVQNFQTEFGKMVLEIQNGAFIFADFFDRSVIQKVNGFFEDMYSPEKEAKLKRMADMLGITLGDAWKMVEESAAVTGQSYDSTIDDMLVSSDELVAGSWYAFQEVAAAANEGMASASSTADYWADYAMDAWTRAIERKWDSIHQAGVDTQMAYNAGIFDSQQSFLDEIDALLLALDTALTPGEEISELRGRKMQLMLARGIQAELGNDGAVAAIDLMISDINSRLATLNGYSYGANLVETLAAGLKKESALNSVRDNAYAVGNIIRRGVGINSEPEDHNSPLYGITKWGGNIVKTIADGIYGELGTGSGAAYALAGALVPSLGGSGVMAAGGMGAGTTINYNLIVEGMPKTAGTRDEVLDMWEQMASMTDRSLT